MTATEGWRTHPTCKVFQSMSSKAGSCLLILLSPIFRYLSLGGIRYSHSLLHALTHPTAAALPAVQAHISSQSHKQGNLVLFISLSMQGPLFLSRQPKFSTDGVLDTKLQGLVSSSFCSLLLHQLVLHSLLNTPFFCPP